MLETIDLVVPSGDTSCIWKKGTGTKMHPLFSLKTFSAHNSCFSQPGVMAELAGVSGADCLQVLYAEVNQVSGPVTSGYCYAEPVYKE